jgi:hypothetical protein|tara:strand:+ start:7763 stop:7891 length:129 start_codon:yes stop_codon:yes gene_type:complete
MVAVGLHREEILAWPSRPSSREAVLWLQVKVDVKAPEIIMLR